MKPLLKLGVATLALLGGSMAFADIKSFYFAPETLVAPDKLPPVGGAIGPLYDVYYGKQGGFSHEIFPTQTTRISLPDAFTGSVYVDLGSEFINGAVAQLLGSRGIRIAATKDDGDVVISGNALYRVHLAPYIQRQVQYNKDFEQKRKLVTVEGAQSDKQSAASAVVSVGSAIPTMATNPAEFLGRLISSAMDLGGGTAAIERATAQDVKHRGEQSFTSGDCYDNVTRLTSCEHSGKKNLAFAMRSRFQYVQINASVKVYGQTSRPFSLVSRLIDGRTETKDDSAQLLALALQELVAGFPMAKEGAPAVPEKAQSDAPKS